MINEMLMALVSKSEIVNNTPV